MTLIDFPKPAHFETWSKPKTLEDWPWESDLGKPYGDINGSIANPPEAEVNDLARYKDGKPRFSPAASVCHEAASLLDGARADQHGDKLALHKTMAGFFSVYLEGKELPLKASDAAMLETLMKAARTKHGLLNKDDFRDGSAYFGIAWECADAGC
jgi:hypothetical protein